MAHGVVAVLGEGNSVKMVTKQQQNVRKTVGVMGSRRIFAPAFKLKVLDSYRNDIDCRGNQRATARKYGIHRRQIQKWLQCEENLRSSCAENVSASLSSSSSSSVSSSVSSSPGTTLGVSSGVSLTESPVEAPGTGVTPAVAPALNLSLARLHGDELAAQQGPPPHPSPPRRNSPSSPQYRPQTGTTVLSLRSTPPCTGYPEYGQERRRVEEKVQEGTVHGYPSPREPEDQQKYYAFNDGYELETSSSGYGCGEVKLYQPLTAYRSSHEHRYSRNDNDSGSNDASNHRRRHRGYGGVSSPRDNRTQTLLLAPAIKTERASPDSAATSGPYEALGSPGALPAPSSPLAAPTPRQATSSATHFEPTRASPIPLTHSHAHVWLPDSENPHEDGVEYGHRPPVSSRGSSGPASPVLERGAYSRPSSPQGPGSSSRSSTSSDSEEMDPLDFSSGTQPTSGDLARRRSFSLRFKLDVLDAFHRDASVAGNQRATARKFGINRRQVQKWLSQETELRGEIALRGGNSRQRLGPAQESPSGESPVDLRTTCVPTGQLELELDSPPPSSLYCCDVESSSQRPPYSSPYLTMVESTEILKPCTMSCCINDTTSCYQELTLKRSCYPSDSQRTQYCYSPKDPLEITSISDGPELVFTPPKKRCTLACCYETLPSPKRLCVEVEEGCRIAARISAGAVTTEQPPQEVPLCLVKPKRIFEAVSIQVEPVTSTVPTPPAPTAPPPATSSKKDAILFKPYLDNPVTKPTEDHALQGAISPGSNINNNNNCYGICNLNESRGHDYALELSLRVPVTWRTPQGPYSDFPQVRSAFVRYPASPHYT